MGDFCLRVIGLLFLPVVAECGIGIHPAGGNPSLHRRAAPRAVDEAERHLELLVDLAAEVVADGAKERRILRCRHGPFAGDIVEWSRARFSRDGEDAQLGEVARCDFSFGVFSIFDDPLHIALAAGQPHFADGDVLHGERVLSRNRHVASEAGLEPFQLRGPAAFFIRRRRDARITKFDGHFLARIRPTPDVGFRVLE